MSRFGAKKGRKLPGAEFTWDTEPGAEADTAPTPLFPKYSVPIARPLNQRERIQVDLYRALRERFHEGPDYSVLGVAGLEAKGDSKAKAQIDPFHSMPTYSGRYQRKRRTAPNMTGRPFILRFFPQQLWKVIQPSYNPDAALDGYAPQAKRTWIKRGFEEDEEEKEEQPTKRRRGGEDEDEEDRGDEEEAGLEEDEEREEEIVDDDFEDDEDEMGGDYNAEQYFDGGDDEYGDDNFMDGVGGAGGDEDTF
ncbi:hypothetical protein MPDQ_000686 [Monascus purpureus]|uniref:DNA-directed RNA polymerase III subunit n=1 Tax=Monascus purpureus TaxID=5098 RepID=A0A507QTC4_MONPU|nr:hypothetical protein MPDQ_000686 [Monascus purpureus]BDD62120.1 hypothetical protein MAP00_007111 [Monascus purpureus]